MKKFNTHELPKNFWQAVFLAIESNWIHPAHFQRNLHIDFKNAVAIINKMEALGVVGKQPEKGLRPMLWPIAIKPKGPNDLDYLKTPDFLKPKFKDT